MKKIYVIVFLLLILSIGFFITVRNQNQVFTEPPPTVPVTQNQQPTQLIDNSKGSIPPIKNSVVAPKENINIQALAIADSRRRADLSNVRVMLLLYHDKHGMYPIAVGTTPEQRWQNLSNTIVTKEDLEKGLITGPLTQDPRQQETGYSYDYKNSPAQDNYVLKTILECSDKSLCGDYLNAQGGLQGDLDGTIFGVNCNDPSYCITAP